MTSITPRRSFWTWMYAGLLLIASCTAWAADNATIEARLLGDISFLASDTLEGRGIDTEGIAKASEYIAEQFKEAGLEPGAGEGSYFQPFTVQISSEVNKEKTSLSLTGPEGKIPLEIGKDYMALAYGGDGELDAPLVFAGYGITAEDLGYDDYAGLDVKGKVVLLMRREPQQADENSPFDGKKESKHSSLASKIQNAWVHKAAAVLIVTDPFTAAAPDADTLLPPNYMGSGASLGIPVAHITQEIANQLLAATPLKSLKEAEAVIDQEGKPASMALEGWNAQGEMAFDRVDAHLVNVIGVLEGEGPKAEETIVIGAHYDHLGYGGEGSLAPNSKEIHNGADDNASGTAALLELARRYGSGKPPARRLVFIAFSAEERGLLGSRHYVKKSPVYPLEETIAMFNFDMVGRVKNDRLIVYGTKTAEEFEALVDKEAEGLGLDIKKVSGGSGASDHASFYQAEIPVFHFFSGTHPDYHKPSDDVEKINVPGMRQVVDYTESLVNQVLVMADRPKYTKVPDDDPHAGMDLPSNGTRPYLGTVPDYGEEVEGVLLNDIKKGSPADEAGLKAGDVIVEIDEVPIRNVQTFTVALYKHKPGDKIKIVVERGGEKVELQATLGSR